MYVGGQGLHAERKPRRLLVLQGSLTRSAFVAAALVLAPLLAACARSSVPNGVASADGGANVATSPDNVATLDGGAGAPEAGVAASANANANATIDPDGDDDPEDPGTGNVPASGHFEKVGAAPMALTRICDLTPLGDALYAAHANAPLGTDGATISRYRPAAEKTFGVAFDWNRPGEPAKGGGAGQGFVRVHAIGGRLFVTDADPPYNGLGLVEYGTEGYVFVSDAKGAFAPPRAPHFRPPGSPDIAQWNEGKAGAGVLPRAYHVLDVIRFRGALYASTGSVPPKERAWQGPSPGALHRANEDGSRWTYEADYPNPWLNGVWRLTYMTRFADRLYVGIQDYDGRDPNDYLLISPPASKKATPREDAGADAGPPEPLIGREDIHPMRVTASGAAGTLRWWVDTKVTPHRLYWIAWSRADGINLRVTTNGRSWEVIPMASGAGRPTDITRFRDKVVVLTERGLYRLDGDVIDPTPIASIDPKEKKSPFEVSDFFCVAPMAVFRNTLYLGGQRGGALWKLAE